MTSARPKLQFGEHGELTEKTIKQAQLTKEERKRAYQMLEVQSAFLEILDNLTYVVDPDGHVHDLSFLGPTRDAIAWTLALRGSRFVGEKYIRKQPLVGATKSDAHTWVDSRTPENVDQEQVGAYMMPPQTKKLRGDEPQLTPDEWHVKPKIVEKYAPRPEDET